MSRIGFKPVTLPTGVTATINGNVVSVKGPKGELSVSVNTGVSVEEKDGELLVKRANDLQQNMENHGTTRANLYNAVIGVSEGFKKELEISGIGYRCQMKGADIVLSVGFSHTVTISPLPGVKISTPDETHIVVEGIDKQHVGQTAALIHDTKRPEPYGGKGIKYKGEVIIRKEGKRAAATAKK